MIELIQIITLGITVTIIIVIPIGYGLSILLTKPPPKFPWQK